VYTTIWGIESRKAMIEAATRFKPVTEGTMNNVATVEPEIVVRRGPIDMLLTLSEMLSMRETFFTSPVLCLAKTAVWGGSGCVGFDNRGWQKFSRI